MKHFTTENTKGYTKQELAHLNKALCRRTARLSPASPFYQAELEWEADQLLIDYWQGRA